MGGPRGSRGPGTGCARTAAREPGGAVSRPCGAGSRSRCSRAMASRATQGWGPRGPLRRPGRRRSALSAPAPRRGRRARRRPAGRAARRPGPTSARPRGSAPRRASAPPGRCRPPRRRAPASGGRAGRSRNASRRAPHGRIDNVRPARPRIRSPGRGRRPPDAIRTARRITPRPCPPAYSPFDASRCAGGTLLSVGHTGNAEFDISVRGFGMFIGTFDWPPADGSKRDHH